VPPTPILFCSHVTELGGAEQVLLDLFGTLDRGELMPHLACPDDGPLAAKARALGVPVHRLPIGGRSPWRKVLSLPRAAFALRRLAAGLGCRTLVANSMIAGYAAVMAQHRALRAVWHVHVVTNSPFARWASRRAAVRITPSAAGAAALTQGATGHDVRVVPNGVPARFFDGPSAELRQRFAIPAAAPLFGIVGRLDPHKGHGVLLEALARFGACASAPHLAIAGSEAFASGLRRVAGEGERLRARVEALGLAARVHWLGEVADTAPIHRAVDVVVVPSTANESAPRAIAEAQAAGTAVVASAIGGTAEMIADGHTGLLVPPGDAAALAATLRRITEDRQLRRRLAQAGKQHALDEYSLPTFAARCARAIHEAWPTAAGDAALQPRGSVAG